MTRAHTIASFADLAASFAEQALSHRILADAIDARLRHHGLLPASTPTLASYSTASLVDELAMRGRTVIGSDEFSDAPPSVRNDDPVSIPPEYPDRGLG